VSVNVMKAVISCETSFNVNLHVATSQKTAIFNLIPLIVKTKSLFSQSLTI
jgi:hypothetical protein